MLRLNDIVGMNETFHIQTLFRNPLGVVVLVFLDLQPIQVSAMLIAASSSSPRES